MKLYSRYDRLPGKTKHIITWTPTTEECDVRTYELRCRQLNQAGMWFRNLKLLKSYDVPNPHYKGTTYQMFHVEYDRKDEYNMANVSEKELTQLLKDNPDLGVVYQDGKLWLEYVGD